MSSTPTKPFLYVRVKYTNNLPDIPFDPKFIVNPLDISRYVEYKTTSLEKNNKHELLTPSDLGVDIDLIWPDRYTVRPDQPADQDDDLLINEDEPLLQSSKKSVRDKPHSHLHNKVVPWLKKTEYISTEYNRYGSSSEKTETKVGYNVRKNMKDEQIFLDRDSQIKAINQTFEEARKPILKHPTKPGLHVKRVMPVFPDFDKWKHIYAHVKFDSEPADSSKADQMSQAIVRGAYDDDLKENFVVYFLPTEITMADRLIDQHNGLEYTEGKEYEYKSFREYSWSAKQDNHGDDFFFVFRDDCVFYNRLSMEVTLKKRRNKTQNSNSITTLVVKDVPSDEEKIDGQEEKLGQLEKPKPPQNVNLTAEALEDSYEQTQDAAPEEDKDESPRTPGGNQEDASSSSESESSSASSSAASSSSSSEASEDDEDDDDDDDDNDDDDDDDDEDDDEA